MTAVWKITYWAYGYDCAETSGSEQKKSTDFIGDVIEWKAKGRKEEKNET